MPVPAVVGAVFRAIGSVKTLLRAKTLSKLFRKEKPTLGKAPIRITAGIQINAKQMLSTINRAGDKKVNQIMTYGQKMAKRYTPVDTGRAQRGWEIKGKGMQSVLSNTVPYIGPLNRGHSKQARKGILRPTIKSIRSKFR
jgi:hypothetical protein